MVEGWLSTVQLNINNKKIHTRINFWCKVIWIVKPVLVSIHNLHGQNSGNLACYLGSNRLRFRGSKVNQDFGERKLRINWYRPQGNATAVNRSVWFHPQRQTNVMWTTIFRIRIHPLDGVGHDGLFYHWISFGLPQMCKNAFRWIVYPTNHGNGRTAKCQGCKFYDEPYIGNLQHSMR